MAARLFPINVPLTIVWQFTKPDNTNFDITGYNPRLYYRSGNRETEVPSTMISKTGNTLSFTFPTTWPRFEGEYHLKLLLFQNNALWETFYYRQAWAFVRTAIPGSQEATQQNAGETVHLFTCAEYYLFQPIVPTVDSDGYWVVNGTRVTDGSGNPVPSSHTVTYDAETNQIIIDQGRVDKNGNSIAQTITALDDALDNQQELYEAAEGTQSGSVSGDGSRWGSYKAAEAARNAARTTAEGTKNGSPAGDGSMWGEYKAAEAARNTARAASEGTKNGSTAGDGSMWGAFKEGEAARNEASENQEGTKAFSTESDGTRWGEYKNAERERDEARLAAEGSKQRSNAGDGTRWGDYKTAEGERDLQYEKEEGTAASEAHDGTRWGEYKAAEEERDASESRRDSTFNELASDMRSATSAANTAAGAANTAAAGANTAAGKANAAAGRAPYIGENGHWYAWDIESGQYADTGVAALSNSRYEVVSELPDEGDGNILYLVGPNQQGAYDEYVYTKDGEFVQVGSTYVDLEEKVSSDDIDNIIELTQEEFDALQSKDPRAMYIVTNAVPDSDHVGIASLVQTTVATADEGVNVWTCTLTNGQTFTLNVKNGSRGNSGYTGAAGELEVVNALNSDDATAALSAYQGKVLDGKIDQLGQEVDSIEGRFQTAAQKESINLLDQSKLTLGKYAYNGALRDNSDYAVTDYIPVTPGQILYPQSAISNKRGLVASERYIARFRFINGFDADKVYVPASQSTATVASYTVPEGVYYVRLSANYLYYWTPKLLPCVFANQPTVIDYVPFIKSESKVVLSSKNIDKRFGAFAISSPALAPGNLITIPKLHLSKNLTITTTISGTIESVSIGAGYGVGRWVEITPTDVNVRYGANEEITEHYTHGLVLGTLTKVIITRNHISSDFSMGTVVLINDKSQVFKQEIWWPYSGIVFVRNNNTSGNLAIDLKLMPLDIKKPIWMFGDSYFALISNAKWTVHVLNWGFSSFLMNQRPGENASDGYDDFKTLLSLGCYPTFALWCYGMNAAPDEDTDSDNVADAPNQLWMTKTLAFISDCETNGIVPILATIPSVPTILHDNLNAWVRGSGFRYIDFAQAVESDTLGDYGWKWSGTEYAFLSTDGVHPSETGAIALAHRALMDFPELGIQDI